MRYKFFKSAGIAKILAVIIAIVVMAGFVVYNLTGSNDEFRRGVRIEGTDVSGLTLEEGKSLLTETINKKYGKTSFALRAGDKTYRYAIGDISYQFLLEEALTKAFYQGRTGNIANKTFDSLALAFRGVDIEIRNDFDKTKVRNLLEKIKKEIDLEPKDASVTYDNGKIGILEDAIGKRLDIDINKELVENQLGKRNFDDIPLQVEKVEPDITYEEIREMDVVISDFHTVFSLSDKNRGDNIRLACSKLDGIILKTGEAFSMNETLGPRTTKNGYKEAPVIFKNELIPGTGGGICQVTTTLYDTVLKAKLEVVERSPHSMPLGYVQPGQDATIAEGAIDFKFKNSKDYPVCISAVVSGNTIRIRVLGRSETGKNIVKLRSVVLETIPPEADEIEIDDSLPDGEKLVVKEPRNGIRAVLYRDTFSENNVLLDTEVISKDYYKPARGLIKINSNYMTFLTVEGYLNE